MKKLPSQEEDKKVNTSSLVGSSSGFNPLKIFSNKPLGILLGLVFLICVPFPFSVFAARENNYVMVLVTLIIMYAVLASAWNIIGGMGGQFDLAVGAYVGLGAFTTGTLMMNWHITPWIGLWLGGLVAMAFAVLVGLPLFRFKVKEVWYTLSSAALVEVLRVTFLMWGAVGGPTEKYLPSVSDGAIYYLRFNTYVPYYYIMLLLLVIVVFINHRIRNSKLGYSLLALGEDEDAVEVLGVDSRNCKLKALMIYAYIAGFVGGIYACIYGYLHPSFFSTEMSTEVAILGIVGGMGITYGPLLAALVLVTLRELLRARLGGELAGLYLFFYAVVLIVIALFQPRGLAVLVQDGYTRFLKLIGVKKGGHPADA